MSLSNDLRVDSVDESVSLNQVEVSNNHTTRIEDELNVIFIIQFDVVSACGFNTHHGVDQRYTVVGVVDRDCKDTRDRSLGT
ncbi:hypothetical protein D3C87_1662730 [compost metagenome]